MHSLAYICVHILTLSDTHVHTHRPIYTATDNHMHADKDIQRHVYPENRTHRGTYGQGHAIHAHTHSGDQNTYIFAKIIGFE